MPVCPSLFGPCHDNLDDITHIGIFAFSAAGGQFIYIQAVAGAINSFCQGHIVPGPPIKVVKLHDLQCHGCHAEVVEQKESVLDVCKAGLVADDNYLGVSEKSFAVLPGMFT